MFKRAVLFFFLLFFSQLTSLLSRELRLTDVSIFRRDSTSILQVEVQNASSNSLNIFLWADIYDDSGKHRSRVSSDSHLIPLNSTASYRFSLTNLEDGVYKALIVGQYVPQDSSSKLLASTLLMEYVAPFELYANQSETFVINDKIDWLPELATAPAAEMFDEAERGALQKALPVPTEVFDAGAEPPENADSTFFANELVPPKDDFVYYTVRKGDWLSKIAKRFYGDPMKFPDIFAANKDILKNPNVIRPGQQLRIPAADAHFVNYTVKAGDSLSKIARAFYGDALKYPIILAVNSDLPNEHLITPGQILRIPLIESNSSPAFSMPNINELRGGGELDGSKNKAGVKASPTKMDRR
jgi:LysM repeat protein